VVEQAFTKLGGQQDSPASAPWPQQQAAEQCAARRQLFPRWCQPHAGHGLSLQHGCPTGRVRPGLPPEQDVGLGSSVPSKGLCSASEIQLQKQTPETERLGFVAEDETLCSLEVRSLAERYFSPWTALVDKRYRAQEPPTPIFHKFYFSQTAHCFFE